MTAEQVAEGLVGALARDEYEVALGDAAYLRAQREAVFDAM